jgi:hypothetical protein
MAGLAKFNVKCRVSGKAYQVGDVDMLDDSDIAQLKRMMRLGVPYVTEVAKDDVTLVSRLNETSSVVETAESVKPATNESVEVETAIVPPVITPTSNKGNKYNPPVVTPPSNKGNKYKARKRISNEGA